jgi:PAS domain S-box-containing protein
MAPNQKTKEQVLDELTVVCQRMAPRRGTVGVRHQIDATLPVEHGFVSAVLDTLDSLVVVLDVEGRIVCFNRACERLTGYTFDEVRGRCVWDLFLPASEVVSVKAVFDTLRTGHFPNAHENVWITRDGQARLISWSNTAIVDAEEAVAFIVGTGIDITERKRAEEALRDSETRYRAIFDTAVDGIITIDEYSVIETFNPAAERIFGYAAAEVRGHGIDILMPSPYYEEHLRQLHHYLRTGENQIIGIGREVVGQRKDGTTFPMELAVSEMRLGAQRLFTGIVRDITQRKQAETALQESEERFRSLVHTVGSVIVVLSADLRILEFNREAERVCGWTRQEVLGQSYVDLLLPESERDVLLAVMHAVLQGESTRGFEHPIRTRHGQERTFLWNVTRLVHAQEAPAAIIACGQDITERKRAQLEMQRADRLALVGQLASGLAHEIGTPLNVIAGNAELLRLALQTQDKRASELDTIVEQADRITRLIERLLTFARAEAHAAEFLSLHIPLSRALRLLESRFRREAITVIVDVPPHLPPVWGAADQLEQVFLNVLVNAWHAMPEGGCVTIWACQAPDNQVQIVFRDTGGGLSTTELARVFEPFYSTKGDQGTGLGLAICKQIIDSYHGSIQLESVPGAGTTVTIVLPCTDTTRAS